MRYIPGQSLSLVSCDGVASRVGNCPCVRYRRNCQLMASSMSENGRCSGHRPHEIRAVLDLSILSVWSDIRQRAYR